MLESGIDINNRIYDDLIFPSNSSLHGHDSVVQLLLEYNVERNTLRSRLGTISRYSTVPMPLLQVATSHGPQRRGPGTVRWWY